MTTSRSRTVGTAVAVIAMITATAAVALHMKDMRRVRLTDALQEAYRAGARNQRYLEEAGRPETLTVHGPADDIWPTGSTARVRTAEEIARDRWASWREHRPSVKDAP
jgi:hypothetical protein